MSQEGPQQRDPLLFCNSIHPLLISLCSVLCLGYVVTVMKVGHDLDLDINPSKCELITHAECVVTDPTLLSFQPATSGGSRHLVWGGPRGAEGAE